MLEATISLPEAKLKSLVLEALSLAGVPTGGATVSLNYDAGGGSSMDPGNGVSASVSTTMAGQKVNLPKNETELKELVKTALTARGYSLRSLGVSFHYDSGDGPRGGANISGNAFVELPDQFPAARVISHH